MCCSEPFQKNQQGLEEMVRALGFARTIHEVSHPRISVEYLTSDPWGELLRLDAWADLGGKGTKHSALR